MNKSEGYRVPRGDEVSTMSPLEIRMHQACYHFGKFVKACDAHPGGREDWFEWITFSDAFLMSIVSLQDLVPDDQRSELLALQRSVPNVFRVMKLLRNVTTHSSVFAAPGEVVSREINLGPSSWVKPRLTFDRLDLYLTEIRKKAEAKKRRTTIEDILETEAYVNRLKQQGLKSMMLHDLFQEGIDRVSEVCGFPRQSPVSAHSNTSPIECGMRE